ncbi:hypothetical protein [Carboxylicivirga marina]|uniref:Uncharacterized protein n=1 Tax=Carboxylicivirga marina TaxID=2800988 RepID=A0ABS1HES3_9BACT|nr:hypothetical protein [Carboxylicivirga marina]MBK3516173.1 hypothetical protein [Carboxylicivirga marina]
MGGIKHKLKENIGDEVIIHFECDKCQQEQVTYLKKAELFLEEFTCKGGCVMESDCTKCKKHIGWIPLGRVKSLEV